MARGEKTGDARFLFEISGTSFETLVVDFTVTEKISSPFEINLTLACEEEINFDEVVGKEALLTILSGEANRHFHGILNHFMQAGSKGRFFIYEASVVPPLWLLSLEQDCRIFQNKNVPDIVKQILQDDRITNDRFKFHLQNQYPKKIYCVQYRETDLDFISRLLEEEGIFYFFEHSQDKHVLVFGDSTVAYQPIQGEASVTFNPAKGMVPGKEFVFDFAVSQNILPGKMTQRDFNFKRPSLDLTAQDQGDSFQKLEVYDFPGRYLLQQRGQKLTKIRLQEARTFKEKAEGQSACPRFTPGFTFKLTDHEREGFNREYLLSEVLHAGAQPQSLQEEADPSLAFSYSNDFIGIPSSVTFRPQRKTPRPIVQGMQTANVVGPKNEEIYTDKYGRVKVQFHWDREGKQDEKSSCWLRVGQLWAGKGWGTVFIPRVGDEVLVDFIEGDPDNPIVVGSVYNGEVNPLYPLPDEKTKSTIKTKSYPNGQGFNEIRFEDKKGNEEVFVHAEKDLKTIVKSNEDHSVGGDRSTTIGNDEKTTVSTNQTLNIGNIQNVKIGVSRDTTIGASDSLKTGTEISMNAGTTIDVNAGVSIGMTAGGVIDINAGADISIVSGGSITITAPTITFAAGMVQVGGVVQCATLITGAVISPMYTPGLGNLI